MTEPKETKAAMLIALNEAAVCLIDAIEIGQVGNVNTNYLEKVAVEFALMLDRLALNLNRDNLRLLQRGRNETTNNNVCPTGSDFGLKITSRLRRQAEKLSAANVGSATISFQEDSTGQNHHLYLFEN